MKRNTYEIDHKVAKLIIAIIITVLISIGQIIELPWSLILNGLAVFTWFFGVNPTAYLIEKALGHKHKHEVL